MSVLAGSPVHACADVNIAATCILEEAGLRAKSCVVAAGGVYVQRIKTNSRVKIPDNPGDIAFERATSHARVAVARCIETKCSKAIGRVVVATRIVQQASCA